MAENREKLMPKIRFKGFTDAWVQRKLSDVNDVRDGTHDSPKFYEVGHPLVTSKNLTDSGLDMTNISFISTDDFESINKRSKVDVGDILFGMIGTIGNPVITDRDDFAIKNVALIKNGGNIANDFLLQHLKSSIFERYIRVENTGNTQKFLSLGKIRDYTFAVPNNREMSEISNFFKILDNTIALYKRKLDGLKQLKKAYLQQVFPQAGKTTPKVRFEGFSSDWTEVKLGDVVEKLKSYSLSRDVETEDATGYRYIHYGDIHKQVADIINNDEQLPCIKIGDYITLKQGDLVLADASEDYVGIAEPCVILHKPKENIVAGLHTIAFRPLNADSLFLYYLFHTNGFRRFGGFVGTGMKVFGITFLNLSKFVMGLPSLAEQATIGDFFYKLDIQIIVQKQGIDHMEQLKMAYMQRMFI